ncbi:FxSxx-COOH cyclophane-containing RiPP peptide [Umezawaea sp.]|uniref:FxSxx-COOH cyclophane-containing RiPP peptide n=1 Tax=Umezawaea sp. TaxID=1955258 RepID=UPI002ED5DA12
METDGVLESELLDVTGIDLARLDALPDDVLRASLRRVLAEDPEMPEQYAAFQSSL